jgi:hypothetical protein
MRSYSETIQSRPRAQNRVLKINVNASQQSVSEDLNRSAFVVKTAIFWDVALYNLVQHYQRAEGNTDLPSALQMNATTSSEILVRIYETTRCQIPSQGRDNVKCHMFLRCYTNNSLYVTYLSLSLTATFIFHKSAF